MEVRLRNNESIRIQNNPASSTDPTNFIDLYGEIWETAIGVMLYPATQVIQIRRLGNNMKMFVFVDEKYMNDFDFGYFEKAEIVFESRPEPCVHKYQDNICDYRGVRKCMWCGITENSI